MKSKIITIIFLMIIAAGINSCDKEAEKKNSQNNIKEKKSDTGKSLKVSDDFIISYDLQGRINGKMQIFRSGNNFKQVINSDIMGMHNNNYIYIRDNIVYTITEIGGKKFGSKATLQEYNLSKHTGETIIDLKEFEKFLSAKKVTGSEKILGYDCEVYDLGDSYYLAVYDKKCILKIMTPEFMATATKLEMNPSIAVNEFVIPADVDFKNINPGGLKKESLDSAVNKLKN